MGGFSIGYGIGVGPRIVFDPDALAFFNTAGITDSAAKTQINGFITEIKGLGLWNSMVAWPMRSSQNKGSGTIVYSFGGLGTYNGTAASNLASVWYGDGIDFITANKSLTTSLAVNQPLTIFSANKFQADNSVLAYGSASSVRLRRTAAGVTSAFAGLSATLDTVSANTMVSFQIEYNATSSTSSFNGAAKVTRSLGTQNIASFIIGSGDAQAGAYVAFIALFNTGSIPLIHSIYKRTLGSGLALP